MFAIYFYCSQLKILFRLENGKPIADDNIGVARSNECRFIESKSPSLVQLHRQHQHRQLKASLDDAVMHFSPPSKDSINTDFTNLAINETGRNSVSRQSLIGEFAVVIVKSVVGLLRLDLSGAPFFVFRSININKN